MANGGAAEIFVPQPQTKTPAGSPPAGVFFRESAYDLQAPKNLLVNEEVMFIGWPFWSMCILLVPL